LQGHPRFRFTEGSITDRALVSKLVGQADHVYHVAAAIGMRLIIEQTLHTFDANVRGTEVVLAEAAAHGRKILFTSTSEIYGLNEHKPSRETDFAVLGDTGKSRWSYAYSKAMGEVLAGAYRREKALRIVVARLFNTVGTRQTGRYGMVVPTFVQQALQGIPLTVHGDGSQTRCFSDVSQVVAALLALMNHHDAVGQTFNVGADRETRIIDLAQHVKRLTQSPSEITFVPHDTVYGVGFDEIARRVPDVAKLKSLLGFSPERPIDSILADVIAEHRAAVPV
jgi:UDP-glucose 4-epimerase